MLQGPAVMNLHQNTEKDDVSLKKRYTSEHYSIVGSVS